MWLELDALRGLHAVGVEEAEKAGAAKIGGPDSVRPTQPLNGRLVKASFRSGGIIPPEEPPN